MNEINYSCTPLPDSHLGLEITKEITGKIALKIRDLEDHYTT